MTPQNNPLISIIMPCFNSEKHLQEAVESALGQSYSPLELIVIDDGSTDNSFSIIERFRCDQPDRVKVYKQDNRGPYPARNLGLRHAAGEYISFLDADDYWDAGCLEKLYAAIKKSEADLAYCGWRNVGNTKLNTAPYIPPEYEKSDLVKQFLVNCPWPIHAALIDRKILSQVDGFSDRYFSSMDFDLWLRILPVTRKMVRVPECLAFYRWHDSGQISSVSWKQAINAWLVRRDFIAANPRLVSHLSPSELRRLTHGMLREKAFEAFWSRDIQSAHRLFRKVIFTGYWRPGDLKYLLLAFLPEFLFGKVIHLADR